MWVRVQAAAMLPKSTPCGHRAIGARRVSWVGVIEDLAIHRSGPRPTTSRRISVAAWTTFNVQRTRRGASPPKR